MDSTKCQLLRTTDEEIKSPLPRKRPAGSPKKFHLPKKGDIWGHKNGHKFLILDVIPDFIHKSNRVVVMKDIHYGCHKAIDLDEFIAKINVYGRSVNRFRKVFQ